MVAEAYVTLAEAAELEGISYKAMEKRLNRCKEQFVYRHERKETGGKDKVLVAVSSLSKQARNAWKEREKLKGIEIGSGDEKRDDIEIPWYVDMDQDWYIEHNRTSYFKAVELSKVIQQFMGYCEKDKTEYAEAFAQKYLGKSQRTLYRYVKMYLEADAWAHKMEKEQGGNYDFFKVLCLCRKPKAVGNFPSFTPEVKQCIKNIWFNPEFAANRGTREMLYDKLQAVGKINHWERIPSYQSVARYISYMMEDEGMRNAWFLAANGAIEYRNKAMVKGSRDTKGLQVMQIVMGDEHTFDCWVTYKHPNGAVTPIRPKLVAWVDMRSRMILGDVLCKDGNSDILKQSLLKLIYHDAGSVPQYIYIDNGKDYTAKTMTGYDRKDRRQKKQEDKMSGYFDDTAKGFYRSIGIVDDHEALPYQPWSKGQIERFFGGVCSGFTKWFTSYTGTLTGSRTDAKVPKDIMKLFKAGKLLTIEEFYERWTYWLHEVYAKKVHRGLKQAGESWNTPEEVFENADKYFKAAPPKEYATMLMMRSDSVRVYNTGIRKFGYEYRSDAIFDYIGKTVNIKYDPEDIKTLYVFDQKDKKIGEVYAQELLQITDEVSEGTLKHIQMQKRQEKRDKQRLEEANIPFEQLNEQYVGFSSVTGGIDLMAEGSARKKAKVVSLPNDRTYRKNNGKIKKEEPLDNAYMQKQAEDAIKRIRAIGE